MSLTTHGKICSLWFGPQKSPAAIVSRFFHFLALVRRTAAKQYDQGNRNRRNHRDHNVAKGPRLYLERSRLGLQLDSCSSHFLCGTDCSHGRLSELRRDVKREVDIVAAACGSMDGESVRQDGAKIRDFVIAPVRLVDDNRRRESLSACHGHLLGHDVWSVD